MLGWLYGELLCTEPTFGAEVGGCAPGTATMRPLSAPSALYFTGLSLPLDR
eukprot:SAG11_NODE_19234_length_471_cov_1.016129_1_plen_50_part_10